MIDLRMTQIDDGGYDLKFENADLMLAEDGTEAAQHATLRMLIFRGEQNLGDLLSTEDNTGTRWYEVLFDMSKSRAEKELELKRRILGTPGIQEISKFVWTQAAHTVSINAIVKTIWGGMALTEEITPL